VPHWLSAVQSVQLLLTQSRPLLQSLLAWQLPVTQVAAPPVPTQTLPVPHCPSAVHAAQMWLALQTWPPAHPLLSWQVPATQLFETQM
jgi:hypothetical protein